MASVLELAKAVLARGSVSLFHRLESETVKQEQSDVVSPETKCETQTEAVKQASPVSIPDPEREAIMLASGGLPSTWAKVFSALDPDRAPIGLTRPYWLARLDAILIFGDKYGHHLEGLGWNAELLFCLGDHWQRLDQRGIGWFIAEALADGGRVVSMDARFIKYETKRGACRTIENEALA
jgi:hypothetical protein